MQQHHQQTLPYPKPTIYFMFRGFPFRIRSKLPTVAHRVLFGLGLPVRPARDHLFFNSQCHPGLFLIQKVYQALSWLRAIQRAIYS